LKNETEEIGYGHIDYENNKYWLGICILDKFCGNGYGKIIMNYLINYFDENISNNEPLYLCVHTNNISALKLYEKFNFKIVDEIKEKNFYKMEYSK
jgi:ribosomal protein S18 acetylase RimI-like enzyme